MEESIQGNQQPSGESQRARRSRRLPTSPRRAQELCVSQTSVSNLTFAIPLTFEIAEKFERKVPKKPAIPKKEDKPIMGLVSDKNYIVANAVENILAAPKVVENKDQDYLKKKTYGTVPKYM